MKKHYGSLEKNIYVYISNMELYAQQIILQLILFGLAAFPIFKSKTGLQVQPIYIAILAVSFILRIGYQLFAVPASKDVNHNDEYKNVARWDNVSSILLLTAVAYSYFKMFALEWTSLSYNEGIQMFMILLIAISVPVIWGINWYNKQNGNYEKESSWMEYIIQGMIAIVAHGMIYGASTLIYGYLQKKGKKEAEAETEDSVAETEDSVAESIDTAPSESESIDTAPSEAESIPEPAPEVPKKKRMRRRKKPETSLEDLPEAPIEEDIDQEIADIDQKIADLGNMQDQHLAGPESPEMTDLGDAEMTDLGSQDVSGDFEDPELTDLGSQAEPSLEDLHQVEGRDSTIASINEAIERVTDLLEK